MWAGILSLPLIVLLMGVGAAAMLVPAVHGFAVDDEATARAFFHASAIFLIVFAMIAMAVAGNRVRNQERSHLVALVAAFTVLPAMFAVPFVEAVRGTTFLNGYLEMVSSLTTTGASFYVPARLPDSVHLWRALVGWMGGYLVWVTAVSILAPMNLGGFEVQGAAGIGAGAMGETPISRVADPADRLRRFALRLAPVYAVLTGVVWAGLVILGERPVVAICHAMSTLATSGISPTAGFDGARPGFPGEVIVALFLIFALSRLTFATDERPAGWASLGRDPELRLGLLIVMTLPVLLALRHWVGAFEVEMEGSVGLFFETLWGAAFTVLSFLTTTGFESAYWGTARNWSGLESPGLILMGLAVFGGGVATTAGGVKLLRVYALYRHGVREMEKLIHPSSVGGSGRAARRIRRQGAYVAWIFFMLFAMSIAVGMLAFAAMGQSFERSMILTIASLTTTGPLTQVIGDAPIDLGQLSEAARLTFAAMMVVGRLETLAIIALLNPDFWRA